MPLINLSLSRAALPGLAIILSTSLVLGACSSSEEAGHGEPAAHEQAQAEHGPQHSSAGLPDGRLAAGKKLANTKRDVTGQSCVDCHGVRGNAPIAPTYPKIGGQYSDYIAHALQAYRSGARQQALMTGQAKGLTDQQIADLAAWFGSREGELVDLANVE